jgi:hypothetical protein
MFMKTKVVTEDEGRVLGGRWRVTSGEQKTKSQIGKANRTRPFPAVSG